MRHLSQLTNVGPHDYLCPKTWARDECWCDLYKSTWMDLWHSMGQYAGVKSKKAAQGRVFMYPNTWVDGGVSC